MLRFDKVTESLKVGTFFETQCRIWGSALKGSGERKSLYRVKPNRRRSFRGARFIFFYGPIVADCNFTRRIFGRPDFLAAATYLAVSGGGNVDECDRFLLLQHVSSLRPCVVILK